MVTCSRCWPRALGASSMRAFGPTSRPVGGATAPSTRTQPLAIQSSASRREPMPSSAMRLFRREVGEAGFWSGIGSAGDHTGTQRLQVEDAQAAVFDPDDAL